MSTALENFPSSGAPAANDLIYGDQSNAEKAMMLLKVTGFSVASIAALRAIPVVDKDSNPIPAGTKITVLGYYAAGDGGGGPIRYWASGAAPGTYVDNGGSTIVPNGGNGSEAWLWAEGRLRVHLRWFGAHADANPSTGAGTDDSAIFNVAALYLHTNFGGGCIYLGNANYLAQSATCMLYDNITVEGDGDDSCWVISPTAVIQRNYDGVTTNMAGVFFNADLVNGNNHVRLRNFKIDGSAHATYAVANNQYTTCTAGMGIGCYAPQTQSTSGKYNTDWVIEGIHTYNTFNQGMFLRQVYHCTVKNCFAEITVNEHADGMSAHLGYDVQFIGNRIYSAIDDCIALEDIIGGVVANNTIDRNNTYVLISGTYYYAHAINIIGSGIYTCSDVTVTGNSIRNCRQPASGVTNAPAISVTAGSTAYCYRTIVSSNTIAGTTRGIYVGGANTIDTIISDNIVEDSDHQGIYVAGAGIGTVVSDNRLHNVVLLNASGEAGIEADNTGSVVSRVSIRGNVITNDTASTVQGILITSVAPESSVTGNTVRNFWVGIYVLTTDYVMVDANRVFDSGSLAIYFNGSSYANFLNNFAKQTSTGGTAFGKAGSYTSYTFNCRNNIGINFTSGDLIGSQIGTTANRPTMVILGFEYFDTTLGKPIWLKATTPTWVDATGTTV